MVTMKDIAMIAGVSRQAVSSALSGNSSCRISEAKRNEIKRIAQELNYVSNAAACSLKGCPSKTIGFMGTIADFGLNSALINEITQMLTAKGYNILHSNYGHANFNATQAQLSLLARGVDGIVVCNSEDIKDFERNQTVPYLFYSHNNCKFMDIGVDNAYGGYLATKHLLEHGHKKVALLTTREYDKTIAKVRGWIQAHREAGIELCDEDMIVLRKLNGNVKETVDYIKKNEFTAIFATNDFIGAKAIKIFSQNNIKVPEDIAIVGYDGYSFTEFCSPALTTIIQPIRPQAEFGVNLLLERIKNKEIKCSPVNKLIKPILYKGSSCGCQEKTIEHFYRINNFNMLEKDAKINFDIDILK
ncbi:MAG: LacI family DNA-binding transcriptional regulator [Victivallales bacterium]|nr:LacI family DNA-binding transcriptional regulator [Victivallales bacterium]